MEAEAEGEAAEAEAEGGEDKEAEEDPPPPYTGVPYNAAYKAWYERQGFDARGKKNERMRRLREGQGEAGRAALAQKERERRAAAKRKREEQAATATGARPEVPVQATGQPAEGGDVEAAGTILGGLARGLRRRVGM